MTNKTCIIIVGPTAVGKTTLSIDLAKLYHTEIISADSRQCYKELNIGVAKPSLLQLKAIPHHFINTHSILEEVNVKSFEKYALATAYSLFEKNDVVVLAGGTGLYIKAFCEGLDEIPPVDKKILEDINFHYDHFGIEWLQNELKNHDPEYSLKGEIKNPHRCIRALSVKLSTGKSLYDFHAKKNETRNFDVIKIGLELPRQQLIENINTRVYQMMTAGLLNETKQLIKYKALQALQTVGYKELFDFLENRNTLEDAIENIKINTRKYAKRQMTWFKKDKETKWFTANCELDVIKNYIDSKIMFNK